MEISERLEGGRSCRNALPAPDRLMRIWQGWPSGWLEGTEPQKKRIR